jgi:hypothetical protein
MLRRVLAAHRVEGGLEDRAGIRLLRSAADVDEGHEHEESASRSSYRLLQESTRSIPSGGCMIRAV